MGTAADQLSPAAFIRKVFVFSDEGRYLGLYGGAQDLLGIDADHVGDGFR